MFLILFRNILCPHQMFPSLCSPRNIVDNNVSETMCPRLSGPLDATPFVCFYFFLGARLMDDWRGVTLKVDLVRSRHAQL